MPVRDSGLRLPRRPARAALAALAALSAVATASAADVTWKSAVSGNWSDTTKWNPANVPTSADTAKFVAGTYTIVNDTGADIVLGGLGSNAAGVRTYDLGGYTLSLATKKSVGNFAQTAADGPLFRNGVVDFTDGSTPLLGANGSGGNGMWAFSGADYYGTVNAAAGAHVLFSDGAKWLLTGNQNFPNVNSSRIYSGALIRVSGTGSKLSGYNGTLRQLTLQGNSCTMRIEDGAEAEFTTLAISGRPDHATLPWLTNTVEVSDSSLSAATLSIGFNKNFIGADTLHITGSNAVVRATTKLQVYKDQANTISFHVPAAGFIDPEGNARVPLQAAKLEFTARGSGWTSWDATRLLVDPSHYMNSHPSSQITLVKLGTANAAGLQELCDHATLSGYDSNSYVSAPTLSVSADGTEIVLHAPAKTAPQPPVLTAVTGAGASEGVTTVTATFTSYGNFSDSASLDCVWSYSPDLSDATTQHVATAVSGFLPYSVPFDISGYPDHAMIYCRLVSTNDTCGTAATYDLSFEGGGFAEDFRLLTDGSFRWSDPAAWSNATASAGDRFHTGGFPHMEDGVSLQSLGRYHTGKTVTITVDADGCGFASGADLGFLDNSIDCSLIWKLCGHEFTIPPIAGNSPWAGCAGELPTSLAVEPTSSKMVFEGPGTFRDTNSPGIRFGFNGAGNAGSIVVTGGAKWVGRIGNWNNGSRVLVEDGEWELTGTQQQILGGSLNTRGYALIAATGTTSRITAPGTTFYVNQKDSAFVVAQGARLTANSLSLPGSYATTNVSFVVDDATATAPSMTIGAVNADCNGQTVKISGASPSLTVSELAYYEGSGTVFEFQLPREGWDAAPLRVTTWKYLVNRTAPDNGGVSLRLGVRDWAEANPCQTNELLRTTSFNGAAGALETLAGNVSFTDLGATAAAKMKVAVSADGKAVIVVAPRSLRDGTAMIVR